MLQILTPFKLQRWLRPVCCLHLYVGQMQSTLIHINSSGVKCWPRILFIFFFSMFQFSCHFANKLLKRYFCLNIGATRRCDTVCYLQCFSAACWRRVFYTQKSVYSCSCPVWVYKWLKVSIIYLCWLSESQNHWTKHSTNDSFILGVISPLRQLDIGAYLHVNRCNCGT